MTDFTRLNLEQIDDVAPGFGLGEFQSVRFAGKAVDAGETGFSHMAVKPDQRPPFAHRHQNAEEVYVVIAGSGRVKLDDEILELKRLDAVRVASEVTRAFEAGPDGLEVLAFGPRRDGDGEIVEDWWID